MTNNKCTTIKNTFKHLTAIQRGRLEEMKKSGDLTQVQMAIELGVTQSTISRELKRGNTRQMASNRTIYKCYLADAGARVYEENRRFCQAKNFKKYDADFLKELPKAIVSTNQKPRIHSVDTFVHTYQKNHPDKRVPCTKTVYALIDQGVLSVRNIDLPMKTRIRPRKKKSSEPKGKNAKHLGRSIEERDPAILLRDELGHWEVDLVLGKKTQGEPVILTMVERKSRVLLTKKVWSMNAEAIQKAVQRLIEKQGLACFKSLTTDNGAEFSTLSLVEQEIPNMKVFFTHAFAAWEKGTNERHNGLLREFIPKGKSLKFLKYSDLKKYTNAINCRPRRLLDYQTPKECLNKELEYVA